MKGLIILKKEGKTFTKRIVVFALLIATLSAAVYINWRYGAADGNLNLTAALSSSEETTKNENYLGQAEYVNSNFEDDYFSKTKTSRESERKKSLETLKEVLNNVKSTDEAKLVASEKIAYFSTLAEKENSIESLVTAKGFENCVAVLSDKSISVVVKVPKSGLTANQTAQIQDIILSNVDLSSENIKIIEIK